ncbi:MAG: hypothetical protein K8I60_04555, partial [Anaerolineae bacterium]|nr:hypothetical protein [Anaerolineae bacterium]
MRRCVWIFLLCLVVSVPVLAQDTTGYPLPDSLQPITPENAGQLRPLASIGGDLMGEMAWSPDGKWLAVGTTGGVRVYDTADSRMLPRQYPGDRDVDFDSQGNLVSAGRVTDVVRGITTEGVPETGPSSRLTVIRREEGGEAVVVLTDRATGQETTLRTGLTGTVNAVVFSPDEQKVVIQVSVRQDQAGRPAMFLPAAQLWDVTESRLIAPLELNSSFDSFDIRFYAQGQRLVIASSLEINYEGPYALLQIWDVPTGHLLVTDETPISWIRISPDDRLLAYPAWDGVALWSDHEIGTLGNGTGLFPIFSPDGHWLAGYRPEGVFLWTIDPARLPGAPDKTLTECCIDNVVFSPDSARLAIYEHGINGYQTRLWNVEAEATEIATSSMGVPLQFSPDSRWILAKQQDSEIYALWDA